jgi:hypothetical protein
MGDDIGKAGRELVVGILQGLKPVAVPLAAAGVVGAYKFTQGAFEMLKSRCRTPEQHARLEAVQAAAAARPSATPIHGDDIENTPIHGDDIENNA